jgi:hypothetical protein
MSTYLSQVSTASATLGRNFDEWINALFGGKPDQTCSERTALAAQAGSIPGCIVCALLSVLVQWGHCKATLDPNGPPTPASAYVRAGLCFVLLMGAVGNGLLLLISWTVSHMLSVIG